MKVSRNVDLRKVIVRTSYASKPNVSVYRSSDILDPFRVVESVCPGTGEKVYTLVDDLYLLLEAEKKKRFSPDTLNSIIDSMSVHGSSFDSLRSKLSDDQLINLVKSRHIQSPSDVQAWANYLNSLADSELKDFAADLESLIPKAPEPEKIQKVEVVNSPKSE